MGQGVAFALAAALAGASAPSGDGLAAFDRAMAAGDAKGATDAYSRAIDARILAGAKGHDPAIAEMAARLFLRQPATVQALAMLREAVARATVARREPLLLGQAQAEESLGLLREAEAHYRALAASGTRTVAEPARLGLARRLLDRDVAAADALLAGLDGSADPDLRWEAALLRSRARALAGDAAGADAALTAAWALAITTRDPALAVDRVARDRALGRSRSEQVALAGFLGNAVNGGGVEPPACAGGLRPEDVAVVEVTRGWEGPQRFSLVRASRPEAAAAFVAAVASVIRVPVERARLVALRCTRAVTDTLPASPAGEGLPMAEWMMAHDLYIRPPEHGDDGEALMAELRARLATIRAHYGAGGVEALPTLLLLAAAEQAQATNTGNPVFLSHARSDLDEAAHLAAAAGAPADGLLQLRSSVAAIPEDLSISPEAAADRAGALLRKAADPSGGSIDAAVFVVAGAGRSTRLPLADRTAALDGVRAALAARGVAAADPRARALAARKLALMQEASQSGVPAAARAAGIDSALCQAADAAPHARNPDAITSEDFPKDLLPSAAQGVATIEYDVDAAGRVSGLRVVASTPAGLFDGATEAALAKLTFEPARIAGRPVACHAARQTFRWQVPTGQNRFERALAGGSGY